MSQQYEYPLPPVKNGLFRSLSVKNFRLYFIGHFISMVGVWMQVVALSWLIWRLTGSGDWLGAVGFSSRILTLLLGLIGGAVADRIFRRNLILITQCLSMTQATLLAILTVTALITPGIIIGLVLFMGAIYAFDFTARQSFITDMVGKEYVDNAVALSSSAVHAARVIGPAIAGFIVAKWGESACFIINAATFVTLIIAMLLIDRSKLVVQKKDDLPMYKSIQEGLKMAWQTSYLRRPLMLLAMISFFVIPYYILIPIFVDKIYGKGPEAYGFLMAVSAVGSLIGGLIMARSKGADQVKRNTQIAAVGLAVSTITFAWMNTFAHGLIVMFFVGLFALVTLASINAWLQKQAPDHIRGRIMSLYTMMFFGCTPIGALIAGFSAERIGAPATLTIGSGVCLAYLIWFLFGKKPPRTTEPLT